MLLLRITIDTRFIDINTRGSIPKGDPRLFRFTKLKNINHFASNVIACESGHITNLVQLNSNLH